MFSGAPMVKRKQPEPAPDPFAVAYPNVHAALSAADVAVAEWFDGSG